MIRSRRIAIERLLELRRNDETTKRRALGAAVTRLAAADAAAVAARWALETALASQRGLLAETAFDSARMKRAVAEVSDREGEWRRSSRARSVAEETRDRAEAEYRAARAKAEALARLIQRRADAERAAAARLERQELDAVALARHVRRKDPTGNRVNEILNPEEGLNP